MQEVNYKHSLSGAHIISKLVELIFGHHKNYIPSTCVPLIVHK